MFVIAACSPNPAVDGGVGGGSVGGGSVGGGSVGGGSVGGGSVGGGSVGGGSVGGGSVGGGSVGGGSVGGGSVGGGTTCVGVGPFAPHLVVTLIDGGALPTPLFTRDQLDLRVVDLPPCSEIALDFRLDAGFSSSARFRASPAGVVSTATDAPSAGTWTGAEANGLFFSMSNGGTSGPTSHDLFITGRWDGGAPLSLTIPRLVLPPGTVVTSFRETTTTGLYADFYRPPGAGPFPTVIVFGGSEGGLAGGQLTGAGLVREGFAVLAIAYWSVPGKPSSMSRIPLEIFQRAVQRARQLPDVRTSKIAVLGVSRGGEAALLAGASFPNDVQAVVAVVPSGFAWAAPGSSTTSTWTLDGGDVPFLAWPTAGNTVVQRDAGSSVSFGAPPFLAAYRQALDAGLAERAAIPVESIAGPVLMVAASDDGIWPSCPLSSPAFDRLTDAGHVLARGDQFICFSGAGHSINPSRAGFPLADLIDRGTTSPRTGYGGSAVADDRANQQLWPLTRDFLQNALR